MQEIGAPSSGSIANDIANLPPPLDGAGTRSALGMAAANLDTQLAAIAASENSVPPINIGGDTVLIK